VSPASCSRRPCCLSTAAGAKPAAFTTVRHQTLGIATVTTYPQEAILKATAFKVLVELALDIPRQCASLRRQVDLERRIVFFDKLVKEGSFRTVAFIARRTKVSTGFPASRQRQQVRILAKSSCLTGPFGFVAANYLIRVHGRLTSARGERLLWVVLRPSRRNFQRN
jgi:hypothetical protein